MRLITRQLLVCLGTAHVLGDFFFQSDRMAQDKQQLTVLGHHALTVAALSYLLCGAWRTWLIPVGVFIAHAVVDAVKARVPRHDTTSFLLDQLAHAITIVIIAFGAARQNPSLSGVALWGEAYPKVLIVVAGVVLTVFAGGVLLGLFVDPLLTELKKAVENKSEQPSSESRGFEHGGRLIGRLERALIFLFVLSGQPASIGFLIAAKSVFRFGELKEHRHRMEAEYIIIGTLMSFGFGLLIAYVTASLLEFDWV